jgi:hypothetical protein
MKRLILLQIMCCLWIIALSQAGPDDQVKPGDKYFFGLNYTYIDNDVKLLSMTKQSVWAGDDFGTVKLDQDEIDTLNSFVDYGEMIHEVFLSAGMALLDRPENPWTISGIMTVGFGKREHTIFSDRTDSTDMSFISKINSPSFGIGLNFKYSFNDKWSLVLHTHTVYMFGSSDNIVDNIYSKVGSLEEERINKFDLSYTRVNFMAAYTYKDFTFSLGPGFYLLYNWNDYDITRTNPTDGQVYKDCIKTTLRNINFVDGSLRIDWKAADHLLINAGAGFSNDITVTAGIFYLL